MSDLPGESPDSADSVPQPLTPLSGLTVLQNNLLKFFLFSLLIFVGGCIGGYLVSAAEPTFGESLLTFFQENVVKYIMDPDPSVVASRLFMNNLETCVLLYLGGCIAGIVPFFVIAFNGVVFGAIIEVVQKKTGEMVMLAAIIPHGVFELPAVLVSAALGLLLGKAIIEEMVGVGDAAFEGARLSIIFITYVIPFIAFSAFMEAFITPAILQMVT
ncbi:MAG TPA: stage II sporulation protein M [Methanospirillum sp.]|nr:stage II sporulation protein M [Methanospirillum sp.]